MTHRRGAATFGHALNVAFVVGLLTSACGGEETPTTPPSAQERLIARGRDLFADNCPTCHGVDLEGTSTGPPFLHEIYAPNHHPDEAFYAAVAQGVRPHHWRFGPMPPVPSLTEDDVRAIVAYIRSVQEREGILVDPSH